MDKWIFKNDPTICSTTDRIQTQRNKIVIRKRKERYTPCKKNPIKRQSG